MRFLVDSRRILALLAAALSIGCGRVLDNLPDLASCGTELDVRPFAQTRDQRFLGKMTEATARCRGGGSAVAGRDVPWTDWQNYWSAGSESSKAWWATKNVRLASGSRERKRQEQLVATLREVHGQHRCDARKIITISQRNADGTAINDCLGHADGSMVDNIEDLDTAVGYLAETTRPHGFAISETQFVVFILNASRRLFSDRFFTSSFRPEFYSTLGVDWVNNNGPVAMIEPLANNGHSGLPVSPLKRILLRVAPELAPELSHVVNAFDPWARDRGAYYSLDWKPRKGAEKDPAFKE
jgi:hypothetical protein